MAGPPKPRNRLNNSGMMPWLLLAPTLIVLTLVGIYPLLYSLWVSTTGYRPTNPDFYQGFVFLDNYGEALTDYQFWHSLLVTAVFSAGSVTISLILGFGLALLFNLDLPGFTLIRTLILIPMLLTPIAVGILWRVMFLPDVGILNYILTGLGFSALEWTGSTNGALASVLLVDVWEWTPFMFLILFAGVRALPRSPFEAAKIDGANFLQTLTRITIPLLKPVIFIAVLLRGIDAVRTYDQIFILTRGGPRLTTDLISIYVQRVNFKFFQIGYGAAVSWLLVIMILVIVLLFIRFTGMTRQFDGEK